MQNQDPKSSASIDVRSRVACTKAAQMQAEGHSLNEVLKHLVTAAEKISGRENVCSILLLDENGLLRNGASPSLPEDYLLAIDGLKPDPNVGTCAASAATGYVVTTTDFYADEKWAELRHLPLSLGFMGAWSFPIKSEDGRVLGTFGTYFRQRREPTPEEIANVSALAHAAASAICRRPDWPRWNLKSVG